jgi:arylsulfatase A-like enzyme
VGKTEMGPRGDVIAELDWCVGEILETLNRRGLANDTLIIFSSDNGPVIDDGYRDDAVQKLGGHRAAGPLRGGKYSAFEGGTRVPFLVRWPGRVKPAVSTALVCQIDLLASLASLVGRKVGADDAPDSVDVLTALLGTSATGRDHLVEHASVLFLRRGPWKLIEPGNGPRVLANTNTETGQAGELQLYNLEVDLRESNNVAAQHPERVRQLHALLDSIRQRTPAASRARGNKVQQ